MRVLLRDLDTGLLYRADDAWVKSPLEAKDFQEPTQAEETARRIGKGNLEVFVVDTQGRPKWGRRLET